MNRLSHIEPKDLGSAFWTSNNAHCREHAAVVWQFSAATEVLNTLVVAQKDIIREGVSMCHVDAFANIKRMSLRAFALEADCRKVFHTDFQKGMNIQYAVGLVKFHSHSNC